MLLHSTHSELQTNFFGLDRVELLSICLVAFVLPAFNGRPYRFSSGFVCLVVAFTLLIYGTLKRGGRVGLPRQSKRMALILAGWVLVATASTLANLDAEAAINLLWGYWVPFMLFMAIAGLKASHDDFQWILASFALGLALRFGYSALVFYSEWGILALSDLFTARYDQVRMETYKDATFGSTGNTAAIVCIAVPILVSSLFLVPMRMAGRAVVMASIAILALNALMTGSRGAILVIAATMAVLAFKLKARSRYALILLFGLAAYLFTEHVGSQNMESIASVVTMDVSGDRSLEGRVESIKLGLRIMMDYPMGLGPGIYPGNNSGYVPHQFAVAQGSQLGVLGMIIVLILAGFIIARTLTLELRPQAGKGGAAVAFRFGAFSWAALSMTASMPLNSGATIPWIGMLAMFLALDGMADQTAAGSKRPRIEDDRQV